MDNEEEDAAAINRSWQQTPHLDEAALAAWEEDVEERVINRNRLEGPEHSTFINYPEPFIEFEDFLIDFTKNFLDFGFELAGPKKIGRKTYYYIRFIRDRDDEFARFVICKRGVKLEISIYFSGQDASTKEQQHPRAVNYYEAGPRGQTFIIFCQHFWGNLHKIWGADLPNTIKSDATELRNLPDLYIYKEAKFKETLKPNAVIYWELYKDYRKRKGLGENISCKKIIEEKDPNGLLNLALRTFEGYIQKGFRSTYDDIFEYKDG
jgi:hypothetical protein